MNPVGQLTIGTRRTGHEHARGAEDGRPGDAEWHDVPDNRKRRPESQKGDRVVVLDIDCRSDDGVGALRPLGKHHDLIEAIAGEVAGQHRQAAGGIGWRRRQGDGVENAEVVVQNLILLVLVEGHRDVDRDVPQPGPDDGRLRKVAGAVVQWNEVPLLKRRIRRGGEAVGALVAEHDIVGAQDVRPPEQDVIHVFETRLGGVGTASVTGIPLQRLGWIHERRLGELHRVLGCGRAPEHSGRVHDADAEQNDHERYGPGPYHIGLLVCWVIAGRGGRRDYSSRQRTGSSQCQACLTRTVSGPFPSLENRDRDSRHQGRLRRSPRRCALVTVDVICQHSDAGRPRHP